MTDTGTRDDIPTREEMLVRARELAGVFGERADEAQRLRRLPDASAQDMFDAGFARMLVPRRFGGYEMAFETWFDTMREVSKGDASHGWVASLLAHTAHYVAMFPQEGQREVWADGPDVSVSGGFLPLCTVVEEGDGYRIDGRSPFASGICHSTWAMVGGFLGGPGGEWLVFLVPREEFTIEDDWFTEGMRGTGSNTVVTERVWVPAARAILHSDLVAGTTPGGKVHANPVYNAPWFAFAPLTFILVALGAAQGAYEQLRDRTKKRRSVVGTPMAEITSVQVQLGRVAAQLDAAELLLRRAANAVGQEPRMPLKARTVRDTALSTELIVAAVDTVMALSGMPGFREGDSIHRAWHDVRFATAHVALNRDVNYSYYGRVDLEVEHPPETNF